MIRCSFLGFFKISSCFLLLFTTLVFSQENLVSYIDYPSELEVKTLIENIEALHPTEDFEGLPDLITSTTDIDISPTELETEELEFLINDLFISDNNSNSDYGTFSPAPIGNPSGEVTVRVKKRGARLIAFVPGFNRAIPVVAPGGTGAAMMSQLMRRMQRDHRFSGMYDEWFMVSYNQYADAEQIADQIERQVVGKIVRHGITDVKVDFVTHSLGSPAAMFAAANDELKMTDQFGDESWISQHVGMMVNLSGANFGQNQNETFGSRIMAQLQPYVSKFKYVNGAQQGAANNVWLHNWFVQHRDRIANWQDICAMWSRQDQMVKAPHDAGALGISRHGILYTQPSRSFEVSLPIPRFMRRAFLMTIHIRWLAGGRTAESQRIHNTMYNAMKNSCWGMVR